MPETAAPPPDYIDHVIQRPWGTIATSVGARAAGLVPIANPTYRAPDAQTEAALSNVRPLRLTIHTRTEPPPEQSAPPPVSLREVLSGSQFPDLTCIVPTNRLTNNQLVSEVYRRVLASAQRAVDNHAAGQQTLDKGGLKLLRTTHPCAWMLATCCSLGAEGTALVPYHWNIGVGVGLGTLYTCLLELYGMPRIRRNQEMRVAAFTTKWNLVGRQVAMDAYATYRDTAHFGRRVIHRVPQY
jgi:hypothetical protein